MLLWRRILRLPASARPSSSFAAVARRSFPPGARLLETSDFCWLRAPDSIYIDKSRFIETFLSYKKALHVIKRPRRCGKTSLLSMFENFFRLEPSTWDQRAAMFSGLDIKEKYTSSWNSHFGKYPVLHLDFKNFDVETYDTFRSSFALNIRNTAKGFDELGYFKNLAPSRAIDLQSLMTLPSDGPELLQSLWLICHLTKLSTGIPPVVLFDEYDSPIAHASEREDVELLRLITADMRTAMTRLFKVILDPLSSPILCVSQMPESGYLSRLNNLQIFGVANTEYAEACHFSVTDVEDLFHHYTANIYDSPPPFDLAQLVEHYNGYCTPPPSSTPLCIPFAVTSALNRRELLPFWTLSGADHLLRNMLLQISKTDRLALEEFYCLLGGEMISFKYCPTVRFGQPATTDEFWSLMLDAGYIAPADGSKPNAFNIPNPDVSRALLQWVPHLESVPKEEAYKFAMALLEGNVRDIYSIFSGRLLKLGTQLTASNKEYCYHCFAYGILSTVSQITCLAEQEAGRGRLDIVIVHNTKPIASILEFKGTQDEGSLPAAAKRAYKQIRTRHYSAWLPSSVKRVTEVGIACHGTHAAVGCRARTRTEISGITDGWSDPDDAQLMTAALYDQN
ncbi:hypothetical protein GGX14DRAFT_598270, partial [Mycena pura]